MLVPNSGRSEFTLTHGEREHRLAYLTPSSPAAVELTGPYFHNFGAQFTDVEEVALVDFLLALTDARVKFERAPFDHPELIVPLDGTAPDNVGGRSALLADARFRRILPVGAAGRATPLANYLGVSSVEGDPGVDHFDSVSGASVSTGLVLSSPVPGVAGVANTLTISGATPGAVVGVYSGLAQGSNLLALGNCAGIPILLANPYRLLGRATANAAGVATLVTTPPASSAGKTFLFQAVEPASCRASNLVSELL